MEPERSRLTSGVRAMGQSLLMSKVKLLSRSATRNIFIPGNFKKGDLLVQKNLVKNSNACLYKQPQSYWTLSEFDGWESGTGTVVDRIGSTTPYARNVIFCPPTLILSAITQEAVAIVGDSLEEGGPDTVADNSLDTGLMSRVVGRDIGYLLLARSGSLLSDWLSAGRTYRDQLLTGNVPGLQADTPYFSAILNGYGINDANGGRSGVDIAADRAAFAALYNAKTYVCGRTLLPVNSSSDGNSTIAGQSDTGASPRVREFNKLERLGIAGEANFWDAAAFSDPLLRDLWPPSPDPSATVYPNTVTGAAGYVTPAPTNVTGSFTSASASVTVSSAAALVIGQMVSIPIAGLKFGTRITAIAGSVVTLSNAFTGATTAGVAMTFDGSQLTITTAPTSGAFVVGDTLSLNGGALPAQPGTVIVAFGTATGNTTGTMCVNFSGRLREAVGTSGTPVTIRTGGYAALDNLHATTKHAENIARRGKSAMTAMIRR